MTAPVRIGVEVGRAIDAAAVLDGGVDRWKAEVRPLSTEPPRHAPARFVARPRPVNDPAAPMATGPAPARP